MKIDRKFLEKQIKDVTAADVGGNLHAFHEFGKGCADMYLPALLDEIDVLRGVKTPTGAPDFDAKTCESCYWRHQAAKLGCSFCADLNEYVDLFSPNAAIRHKELLEKTRVKK